MLLQHMRQANSGMLSAEAGVCITGMKAASPLRFAAALQNTWLSMDCGGRASLASGDTALVRRTTDQPGTQSRSTQNGVEFTIVLIMIRAWDYDPSPGSP